MGSCQSIICHRAALAALAALLLGIAAQELHAQPATPLSLDEALSIAQARAPALTAASYGAQASNYLAVSASQLPDPVLRAGVDNLPINGPDAWSLERDFMTMRRIGVMQEYVSAEKRQLMRKRNELDAARTEVTRHTLATNLRRDVAMAWLERYYAVKSKQLLKSLESEVEVQLQSLESQLRAGKAMAVESPMAMAMLLQTRDRALMADKQERLANIVLARWLGEDAKREPGALPNIEALPLDLTNPLVAASAPPLQEHAREIDIAKTELVIAEKNKDPNWSWELAYQQRGSDYSNMISFGVSVPLTLNSANRQDSEVAAKRAQVEQAEQLHEDMLREVQSGVASAYTEWQSLIERRKKLADTLLPVTRQRVELSLAGYRAGQAGLASVLEARRAEVEARMQLLDLERETARLWAQLQYVYADSAKAQGHEQGTQP
jgi:outer membrane protein TolC